MSIQIPGVLLIMLSGIFTGSAIAQQQAGEATGPIQMQGMPELLESVRQINSQLQVLSNVSWEYLFMQRNRLKNSDDQLMQLGLDGWELVAVTVEEGFILKRRRR